MKKREIEIIEKNRDNNEPTFQLLPHLLGEKEQRNVLGGYLHCGEEYSITACFFKTSCQGSYSDDSTTCQRGYSIQEPCPTA